MEHLGSAIIVFAVLIGVAVAAIAFEPADPLQKWLKLTEQYGTHDRPSEVQFANQQIRFGGQRGSLRPLNSHVLFDATLDDFGLWLVLKGADDADVPSTLRMPGTHVRAAGKRGGSYRFDLYAEPPVRMAVSGEFGAELHQAATAAGRGQPRHP
jgi:hypothetical protein